MSASSPSSGRGRVRALLAAFATLLAFDGASALAQTALGEIEGRPSTTSHRRCVGGGNAGGLCNEDADCPASTCQDRNVFNVTVNVRFPADATELQTIRDAFTAANSLFFDATDCQAQFGQVTILNNPAGTMGTFWVNEVGGCSADTGTWGQYSGGNINVSLASLSGGSAAGCLAHEFSHLAFDVRDEYESRAVGCGALAGGANCPLVASGEEACLMECCGRIGTEFCWGQGNPLDPVDISGGNHDPNNVTEQSRCRSNRSCWDQIGWSWPNTMLVPAGAPDPTPCAGLDDIVFLQPPPTARVVLVLDRSGSMALEAPSRIERLKIAALDFVNLAENGMELGLVSFGLGPDGVAFDEVPVTALAADRSDYVDAINALTPSGWTNIGDGLQHARDMIFAAGPPPADTYIVLFTDGVNNRPLPDFAADLDAKVATLLADSIPVYVTCTGDDLGLDSQCAEIAAGTGGFYVDSSDSSELPESFADIHERLRGRPPAFSLTAAASEKGPFDYPVLIEPGAHTATFVGLCRNMPFCLSMLLLDPTGKEQRCQPIPQGEFCRVKDPMPGVWRVHIARGQFQDALVSRAYIGHPTVLLAASAQHPVIEPGQTAVLQVRPKMAGNLLGVQLAGQCEKPDGTLVPVVPVDSGPPNDEASQDGTYTALFQDTAQPGAYTCLIRGLANGAELAECDPPDCTPVEATFLRENRFSFTVNDLPPGAVICTQSVAGAPGAKVLLPITLSDGNGVAGFQVDVVFDPAILKPTGAQLGADTVAAGGWAIAFNPVALNRFRVLGHSSPPAGLGPGLKQVALVEFDILAGATPGLSFVPLTGCVLSDKQGLRLPCSLCRSPGGVVVRDAESFRFRPIGSPVGVDPFDPLPFPVAVEALDSMGNVASAYAGVAAMDVVQPLCDGTLQPTAMSFTNGLGGPDTFAIRCCLASISPATAAPLSLEAVDATNAISGASAPFQGVAKGDVDASATVDVLDVTRTVRLALLQPVLLPPPLAFQRWAANMLDPECTVNASINVLDVIRVRNKALGLPPLCPCGARAGVPVVTLAPPRATSPLALRLVHIRGGYQVVARGARDLGGLQVELRGWGRGGVVALDGLTAGQNWQLATETGGAPGRKVLAFGNTPAGLNGDGALLRLTGGRKPVLAGAVASDSQGREIPVVIEP